MCVCVCARLSGVFISVPLRPPPPSSSLEVSSPPPTSLLPGGLGKGLSGRSRQSGKRRWGSEAIGRAAPGEGAGGPHGREGPLGAELPWLLPASPLPDTPLTPLTEGERVSQGGDRMALSAGGAVEGETPRGWSRPGHSQPAPSPGSRRVWWALALRLQGTSSGPAAPSGGDARQDSHPAPNPQPLLPLPELTP